MKIAYTHNSNLRGFTCGVLKKNDIWEHAEKNPSTKWSDGLSFG